MNPEVKQEWVEALRSGEYQQGKSRLKTYDGKFCCLGVLCEIAVKHGIIPPAKDNSYGGMVNYLPNKVRVWSGVGALGELPDKGGHPFRSLSGYNDIGKPFEQIATMIEEEL